MCYSGSCPYETYDGDCRKPRNKPCPQDEEDVAAYEREMEARAERAMDDAISAKYDNDED